MKIENVHGRSTGDASTRGTMRRAGSASPHTRIRSRREADLVPRGWALALHSSENVLEKG